MRRRPLCLAVLLLVLILWILPKDVWLKIPDIPSGEELTVSGTISKREQKEEKQVYYLKDCHSDRSESEFSMIAYISESNSYPIGSKISLFGTIYQLNKATNPGQFDAESYYQSQGILYTFQASEVLACDGKHVILEKIACLRETFAECLDRICNERDSGILKAALLGDRSTLRKEDQQLYQTNGISHLLAISGLHISLVGVSFYKLLRRFRLNYLEAGVPSGLLLIAYGQMTGYGVSTIRAVCMFLVMIFGEIWGRTYDMASAMSLAAMIILIKNPLQARQGGFLLSFGAVIGICVVYPVMQSVFRTKRKFVNNILFSFSLFTVTYPISIHFFYEFSPYSFLLNFIVIPCMPFVMGFGGCSMIVGCFTPKIGKLILLPAHLILSFYELLCRQTLRLPFSVIRLGSEEVWQLILYYILLSLGIVLLWYGRRRVYSLLLPVAFVVVTIRIHSGLEFTMLDVGQGDGLFLRFPGGTSCMIDGGSTSIKKVGEYRILPYLKYEGIEQLDYVIFSHLDEDHINGIRELLEMLDSPDGVSIGQMLFPAIANPDASYEELWEFAQDSGVQVGKIGAGDLICDQELFMECLYPVKNSRGEDKNESSVVLQITYQEFSMLLTGDLGKTGERELLKEAGLKDVDVWKVSHHGSKYSGTEDFLEVIRPNLSLISVGKNNYGHPSKEVLERLNRVGSLMKNTLDQGAILLKSNGKKYHISTPFK